MIKSFVISKKELFALLNCKSIYYSLIFNDGKKIKREDVKLREMLVSESTSDKFFSTSQSDDNFVLKINCDDHNYSYHKNETSKHKLNGHIFSFYEDCNILLFAISNGALEHCINDLCIKKIEDLISSENDDDYRYLFSNNIKIIPNSVVLKNNISDNYQDLIEFLNIKSLYAFSSDIHNCKDKKYFNFEDYLDNVDFSVQTIDLNKCFIYRNFSTSFNDNKILVDCIFGLDYHGEKYEMVNVRNSTNGFICELNGKEYYSNKKDLIEDKKNILLKKLNELDSQINPNRIVIV